MAPVPPIAGVRAGAAGPEPGAGVMGVMGSERKRGEVGVGRARKRCAREEGCAYSPQVHAQHDDQLMEYEYRRGGRGEKIGLGGREER